MSFLTLTVGDGLAFRDFLAEKYPNLENKCVGRAEFSKRSDPYPTLTLTLTLTLSLTLAPHIPKAGLVVRS